MRGLGLSRGRAPLLRLALGLCCGLMLLGCGDEGGDGDGALAPVSGASAAGTGAAAGAAGSANSTGGTSAPPNAGRSGAQAGSAAPAGGTSASSAGNSGGSAPGAGAGGASGASGTTAPPPAGSSGCGAANWPQSGTFMIDVMGTQREYIVKIPADYSPSKPYKLVFAWHGLGGTAQQIAMGFRGGYYGLEARAMGSTIFVAGQGLETSSGGAGWPNTGGRDIAFVRAMLDWLRGSYCIDEERIFSVGMSYGGIMSNTIGCQLGDVFRAIAPMSGSGPRAFGGAQCVGQVAAWLSHGNMDTVVTFQSGVGSRDHWIMTNHCMTTSAPTTPDPCVAYQGCDDGFPVTWCEFDGGHTVPQFASEAIWNFFSQF